MFIGILLYLQRKHLVWLIYALLAAVSESLVTIFNQLGIQKADLTLTTTIRSIIMSVILIITSFALKKFDPAALRNITCSGFGWLIASEVVNELSWIFYFAALRYGLLSKVTAVGQLQFIFVIIFSIVFLGQQPSFKIVLGSLFIIGGMYLVTID
jgi:uncharacterized membrane protein